MKKIPVWFAFIALCLLLTQGCTTKEKIEPPTVKITIGDENVSCGFSTIKWDGKEYDKSRSLIVGKDDQNPELPYFNIGEIVEITFLWSPPDKVSISDILINENGIPVYPEKNDVIIPVELKNGKCSFEITKNMASALNSEYVEGKKDIRGYKMSAFWGDNECEYNFIIKTNAY